VLKLSILSIIGFFFFAGLLRFRCFERFYIWNYLRVILSNKQKRHILTLY